MKKILNNNLIQQLLFWAISFAVLFRLFTREINNGWIDVFYTILFHLPLLLTFYGNYFLVKKYWIDNRRILFYLVGVFALLAAGIGLHYLTFNVLSDWLFPGYYFVSFYTIVEVLEFVGSYLIISTLLFLSKNWFLLKERQLALEKENHQVKLTSLKAQINPHFLFNSLNNIYGSIDRQNQTSRNYLLKLSDALRYMIYDTSEALVPLEKEIDYLKNYVDLEKLRMDEKKAIELTLNGDFSGDLIAPLILLPLVENCFKHCDRTNPKIQIEISVKEGLLELRTHNNQMIDENIEKGNVGLTNLRKRLKLIYCNKHQFTITQTAEIYQSKLHLNINQ